MEVFPDHEALRGMPRDDRTLNEQMSRRATSSVLVGRDEQLTALEGAFERVRQGSQQTKPRNDAIATVLLGGEAGVGKSRLISEFTAAAERGGARVLTGGCMQLGTDGLPYAPFTAIVRELAHELGAEAFGRLLAGRATRELARLLPELGEPPGDTDSGTARARLFEELLAVLEQLAARSPTILIIEDAHWADRSSRELLTFLISSQRTAPGLMIVVSYRSDELHRTHPLRPLLATLDRIGWVERLDVPRLSRTSTRDLAATLLGRDIPDDVAMSLYRRTEGNPLYVESLLSCDGELSIELPESLRDLLIDRVQALPDLTQDVLRAASCGAGVTSHTLLSKVTGLDDQALTDALRPAVIANVLRAEAAGYRFGHELIREAVHDDLLPGEHGRLHIKFAEAIDADNTIVPPGRAAIEMAFHWSSGHDATWALIASWQAAAQAGRAVAPAERLDLLARVLELWDQVPDAAERIGADHVQVLEDATAAAEDAAEYSRGVAFATSALAELDAEAEPVRAAALYAARAAYRLASDRVGYTEDFWEAVRLVPPGRDPRARLKILLGAEHCAPDARALRACSEEALDIAREIGDLAAQARAMLLLAMFDADEGQQAEPGSGPIELIRQARELAAQAGADRVLLQAAVDESHLLEGAGQHELAYTAARDGLAAVAAHRVPRKDGTVLTINQAEPLFSLGRWDETVSLADEALDVYVAPVPGHRALVQVLKGLVAVARGDLPAAARAAATARALHRSLVGQGGQPGTVSGPGTVSTNGTAAQQDTLPLAQLRILIAMAEDATLRVAIATTTQILDAHDLATANPRYAWPVVSTAADLCVTAARQAAVAQDEAFAAQIVMLADRLRTIAEKTEVFGPLQRAHQITFTAADAATRHLLDESAQSAGILAAWDAAAQAWAALSQPYDEARALFRAAEAALADGDRDTAADRLRRAAPLAAGLGAAPLGAQIGILARRARIWLGDGMASGSGMEAAGLTEREIEVLRLVAAGHSNKEIATELFISPKTASVHVSNILAKLNATTRTEAAARAHSLRLLG